MLGFAIGQEHVHRTARRVANTVSDGAAGRRRDVGAANAGMTGGCECCRQVLQPVGVGGRVIIDVGDDLARGRAHAGVAGAAQTVVLCPNQLNVVLPDDTCCAVSRPVVDDNDLEVRVVDLRQTLEALANGPGSVVGADDDRNARPRPVSEGHAAERVAYCCQRRLRVPMAVGNAEGPILHLFARPMPLVGPGKHERAGTAAFERGSDLPVKAARLGQLAVPQRIESDLAEHHRPVAGDVLQA